MRIKALLTISAAATVLAACSGSDATAPSVLAPDQPRLDDGNGMFGSGGKSTGGGTGGTTGTSSDSTQTGG